MGFSCHRLRIHLARVILPEKWRSFLSSVIFSETASRRQGTLPSTSASLPTRYPPTSALLSQRVCPVRGSARATPHASINSLLLLSRNRSRLKMQKFAFHETRQVPCECREIVITIRQVKCCKEKRPKTKLCNQLAGNHRHQQRRCRQTLAQFPFVSKSSADQYTLRVIQLQERHQLLQANF
jgi:hypothetical protein